MPTPLSIQQTNIRPESAPDVEAQLNKKQAPQATSQTLRSKKATIPQSNKVTPLADSNTQPPAAKKLPRRSSKPFINWFQRKLAGTVRARRASDTDGFTRTRSPSLQEKSRRVSASTTTRNRSKTETKQGAKIATVASINSRKPVSIDVASGIDSVTDSSGTGESDDGRRSSLARDSLWSPTSNYEADEDASLRPIPPSSPPSPSPSRSSSSYLSDPRTFRSMTASTKPTTLLSIDLTGGMAHIAQAPPTPTTPIHRLQPPLRTHSTAAAAAAAGSIMFSSIQPPSPTVPSRPSSGNSINFPQRSASQAYTLQAPLHTTHHPRNNPRPSSPPQDDASVLTLASSAFAMPGTRFGIGALTLSGRRSVADDSISHLSHLAAQTDTASHFLLGELDDDRVERDMYRDDQDIDASVRALRPRSSRRGSWESEESKWSASASLALTAATGMTSQSPISHGGHRSLWTNGSFRTGGLSVDHGEVSIDHEDDEDDTEDGDETSEDMHGKSVHSTGDDLLHAREAQTPPVLPLNQDDYSLHTPSEAHPNGFSTPSRSTVTTPKGGPVPLTEHDAMPSLPSAGSASTNTAVASGFAQDGRSDIHSLATSDYHTDASYTTATSPIPQ